MQIFDSQIFIICVYQRKSASPRILC